MNAATICNDERIFFHGCHRSSRGRSRSREGDRGWGWVPDIDFVSRSQLPACSSNCHGILSLLPRRRRHTPVITRKGFPIFDCEMNTS